MKEAEAAQKACAWGVAPKCLARGCMAWMPIWQDQPPGVHLGWGRGAPIVPENPERDIGFCVKVTEIMKSPWHDQWSERNATK